MARYIDADALLQKLPDDLPYKGSVKRVLIQAPEADVAPKSEVAGEIFTEMENIINRYCKDYKYSIADVLLDIAEAKNKYIGGE